MRFLLLLAIASVAFAAEAEVKPDAAKAEPVKEEPKPAESVYSGHNTEHSFSDGLELIRHREQGLINDRYRDIDAVRYDDPEGRDRQGGHIADEPGPVILRSPGPLPHDRHPDIEAQNKIIADVFSPDYYQPTWVLDYRYLKTGGRDYTRGPGGQILILPKGVRSKEHKEFPDYDAYLEHLRLSRLSEQQHHRHGDHHDHAYARYGDHHDRGYHGHGREYDRGHGHGQTLWQKYG